MFGVTMPNQGNERRPGDWMRRDLRSKDSANRIVKTEEERDRRWYQDTFWVIVLLVIFWPAGVYLMWKYMKWHVVVKAIVTIIIALIVIFMFNVNIAMQDVNVGGIS